MDTNSGFIEPTEAEARNGWTPRTLTQYINERNEHQAVVAHVYDLRFNRDMRLKHGIDNNPERAQSDYNPMRW